MPAAQKVGWAQLRVGLMAFVALIIVFALVFVMTGSRRFFARRELLYTYMDSAVGLTPSAPVRLNGLLAGKVKTVELSGDSAPQRVVRIVMEIDDEMLRHIPVDSISSLSAENVLGTKFINIRRGQSNTTVKAGAEIRALDTRDFDEIMQQSYNMLAQVQGIIRRMDAIVGLIETGEAASASCW